VGTRGGFEPTTF